MQILTIKLKSSLSDVNPDDRELSVEKSGLGLDIGFEMWLEPLILTVVQPTHESDINAVSPLLIEYFVPSDPAVQPNSSPVFIFLIVCAVSKLLSSGSTQ